MAISPAIKAELGEISTNPAFMRGPP